MNDTEVKCGECGATEVRLYRQYGNFSDPEDNRCNSCLTDETRSWYVPLCLDEKNGGIWGHNSVPDEAVEKFFSLTDKDPDGRIWHQNGGWRFYESGVDKIKGKL